MDEQFILRNLLSDDDDEKELKKFCDRCLYYPPSSCSSDCQSKCPNQCSYFQIPDSSNSPSKSPQKLSNLVSATIALLSFVFLLVLCYAIYARFYSGRRRRRRPHDPPPPTHHQEFLDEEQGPVLDHPIWYIRTVGLPAAVISAIAVCTFKSGDGLIDGTECSVCLTEFEDGETLRLLPKCSHAFHLPCIDTWLRSHTTCPMCRAPIVAAAAEGTQMTDLQNSDELEAEEANLEDLAADSVRDFEEEDEIPRLPDGAEDLEQRVSDFQPVRRSVSLDSVSALGISSVLGGVDLHQKVDHSSELRQNLGSSPAMNRSVSCSGKFLMRSSTHRSSSATHHK